MPLLRKRRLKIKLLPEGEINEFGGKKVESGGHGGERRWPLPVSFPAGDPHREGGVGGLEKEN